MNERLQQFKTLGESRDKVERFSAEKTEIEKKNIEMNLDEWKMRMKSVEVDILKARGDIYESEEKLGLDKNDPEVHKIEAEAFAEVTKLEEEAMSNAKIAAATPEERMFTEKSESTVSKINEIGERIRQKGYTIAEVDNMRNSDNEEEKRFFAEISPEFENSELNENLKYMEESDPNRFLSVIRDIKDPFFKSALIDTLAGNTKIPHRKIVDALHTSGISTDQIKSVSESVERRILTEKKQAVAKFPGEEILDFLEKDPESFDSNSKHIYESKVGKIFDKLVDSGDTEGIQKLYKRLSDMKKRNDSNLDGHQSHHYPDPNDFFPQWAKNMNTADALKAMTKTLPSESFEFYFANKSYIPLNIVPENLKAKYIDKMFNAPILSASNVQEYLSLSGKTFKDLNSSQKMRILEAIGPNTDGMKFGLDDFKQATEAGSYINPSLVPLEFWNEIKKSLSPYQKAEILKKNGSVENIDFSIEDYVQALSLDVKCLINIPEQFRGELKNNMTPAQKADTMIEFDSNIPGIEFNLEDYKQAFSMRNINIKKVPNEFKKELKNSLSAERKIQILDSGYGLEEGFFNVEDYKEMLRVKYIDPESIPEKFHGELQESFVESGKNLLTQEYPDYQKLIKDPLFREAVFDKFRSDILEKGGPDNLEAEKQAQKMKNIEESFRVLDSRDKLPSQVLEKLNGFKEKYGKKGEGLIALSIVAYGVNNPEEYIKKIEVIEKVLDKYGEENIPDGARVSMGIEYEVGKSNGEMYKEESALGYTKDIEFVNRSSRIGSGRGGGDSIHEIATKPTDNPYMLIAEVKLLQDAGFLDLNFQKNPRGSRGYHLSLGGETSLKSKSKDMMFLNNMMTMSGLTGINAGKEIYSVKSISQKNLEAVFDSGTAGDRVEFKGMSTDSFEQFEQSVLTSYHAGIATQIAEKCLHDSNLYTLLDKLPEDPKEFELFLSENSLSKNPFQSEQEKEIVYSWLKLKKETVSSIRQHNQSFGDSEFKGSFIDKNGEYVETAEHINPRDNTEHLKGMEINSPEFNATFNIPEGDLFTDQTPQFVSALGRVNNVFLFKEPVLSQDKFYTDENGRNRIRPEFMTNAHAMLTRMNGEGYKKDIPGSPFETIFDRGGEMRDGYHYVQDASEEMITHKSQILLNRFNKEMEKILHQSDAEKVKAEQNEYEKV